MGSYKRFFTSVPIKPKVNDNGAMSAKYTNAANHLPEVYAGSPNRIERYSQYEDMDRDSFISASLNIIAEFCSQENKSNKLPFIVNFKDNDAATEGAVETLKAALDNWCYINDFYTKIFHIIRKSIMYGDAIFIRDPETFEWLFLDAKNVEKTTLDENKGKKLNSYFVKNLSLNVGAKVATDQRNMANYNYPKFPTSAGSSPMNSAKINMTRFDKSPQTTEIDAKHVIHLSLNSGMEPFWPFGTSILEPIFKVYKQKTLIEDAIVMYRISRASEKRVFKIDVGNAPPHKAMLIVERMKMELQQRRTPNRTNNNQSIGDATWSPMAINEDFYLPIGADNRGSDITTLPAGQSLGEMNDLLFFTNQLARGLGIPSSYLPTGPEDSSSSYNDGKLGSALIQELRFSRFCERIQRQLIKVFDYEFKLFLKNKGINIESEDFSLSFTEPESFNDYRQMEKDTAHIQLLGSVLSIPFISKRYALKKYGGWTEEEITLNQILFSEENPELNKSEENSSLGNAPSLKDVGISSNSNIMGSPDVSLGDTGGEPNNIGGNESGLATGPETGAIGGESMVGSGAPP